MDEEARDRRDRVKAIKINELLAKLGHTPAEDHKQPSNGEVWYNSPLPGRSDTDASMHVSPSGRGWKDFGSGTNGGDIIEFMRQYRQFPPTPRGAWQAIAEIETLFGFTPQKQLFTERNQRPAPTPKPRPAPAANDQGAPREPIKITKEQIIAHPALIGYLNKRGITPQLARQYLKEIHYSQGEKSYFALGFPNDSFTDREHCYELRNPYFQSSAGTKNISSFELERLKFGGAFEPIVLFEGFFDYLSALTTGAIRTQTPAIVLNTATFKDRALTALRRAQARQVHCYFDNDKAGRDLVAYFQHELKEAEIVDQSHLYEGFKDYNKMLEDQQQEKRRQSR